MRVQKGDREAVKWNEARILDIVIERLGLPN